jgi:hypothetical protein
MPAPSRWDDMVGAIAVIVLLIGTASGSAYVNGSQQRTIYVSVPLRSSRLGLE